MEEIKAHYVSALNSLVDTSKPVINFLTMLAQDYLDHADIVVSVIVERLRRQPTNNIRFLYLLDSIVKNVGGKYTLSFEKHLPQVVKYVMGQATEEVRQRVIRTRRTWDGIFQPNTLRSVDKYIEMVMLGDNYEQPAPDTLSRSPRRQLATFPPEDEHLYRKLPHPRRLRELPPHPRHYPPRAMELNEQLPPPAPPHYYHRLHPYRELHGQYPQPHHELILDHPRKPDIGPQQYSIQELIQEHPPSDRPPLNHADVLNALREGEKALRTGALPLDSRRQLEAVVHSLRRDLAEITHPHASFAVPPHHPAAVPGKPPYESHGPVELSQREAHKVKELAPRDPRLARPPVHSADEIKEIESPTANVLYSQLLDAGVIDLLQDESSGSGPASKAHGATSRDLKQKKLGEPRQQPSNIQNPSNYSKTTDASLEKQPIDLLNIVAVELTDASIKETVEDGYITLMYDAQPFQCKQCGFRFPENANEEFKLHYDWHFRRNQEIQTSIIVSRGWFLSQHDWIHYSGSSTAISTPHSNDDGNQKESDQASTNVEEEENHRVKASDDQTCSLCHDLFDTFYDQEEEEWLLKDAVETKQGLFHLSCYQSASKQIFRRVVNSNVSFQHHHVQRELQPSRTQSLSLPPSHPTTPVEPNNETDIPESKLMTVKEQEMHQQVKENIEILDSDVGESRESEMPTPAKRAHLSSQ